MKRSACCRPSWPSDDGTVPPLDRHDRRAACSRRRQKVSPPMVAYDLTHLTQPDDQVVAGPIQDDEALFLFALIRCMRLRRVLEIGGLDGYSAANFLKAIGPKGMLYTVDLNPVESLAPNHRTIRTNCGDLHGEDIGNTSLDLVFFDCHIYAAQMQLHHNLQRQGMITERTVLALHDTNLHPLTDEPNAPPRQWGVAVADGWMHQGVERKMVNTLRRDGYEALMLHTTPDRHDETLPLRHGLTILTRARQLDIGEMEREGSIHVGSETDEPAR